VLKNCQKEMGAQLCQSRWPFIKPSTYIFPQWTTG
jgi:hypothetical protein